MCFKSILVSTKTVHRFYLSYCAFLSPFIMGGKAKFQLEVSENKEVIFSHPN